MHDEAAPYYTDMVDQTSLGHRFLFDTFGVMPRYTWSIDPFGHSSAQASLLGAEVGFEGFFIGRADRDDLSKRKTDKTLEFNWIGSPSLGKSAQIMSLIFGSGMIRPL